jgi:purine-binding chemotaxis protein CheW
VLDVSQLVVFGLGREEYALPIEQVQEIIRAVEPRTLPHADPGLLGVINLRGVTIPVFDLALVLGGSPQEGDGKIIVIEGESQRVGIVVDEVSEVLTVSDQQLEEPPVGDPRLSAIAKVDERLIVLVDPTALLRSLSLELAA